MTPRIGPQGSRSTGMIGLVVLALMTLAAVRDATAQGSAGKHTREMARGGFEYIGKHPDAAAQPTVRGRRIRALMGWKGLLHVGFGDTGANTGPIAITPYDPAAQAFQPTGFLADTEAIDIFRPMGEKLYAPCSDPGGVADYVVGEPWENRDPVISYHLWDMGSLGGVDLWLCGKASPAGSSAIWRSTDGGQNWHKSMEEMPPAGCSSRFNFIGVHQGKVWIQTFDWDMQNNSASRSRDYSLVFDGASWQRGLDLLPVPSTIGIGYPELDRGFGHRPVIFPPTGLMVYSNGMGKWRRLSGKVATSPLYAFDGIQTTVVWEDALDHVVAGAHLFALQVDGEIHFTEDLSNWTYLATAPPEALSLGIAAGQLFVGGKEAELYRYDGPLP